ncbi:MAG: hypothetical protein ACRCX5_13305 [Bacteroidales bacterium]
MISLKEKAVNIVAKSLAKDGEAVIRKAFDTSDYMKDKTQDLHDSYGCAVYYNGRLIESSKYILTSRATMGVYNYKEDELQYGRNEIQAFFKSYKAVPKGFELVTAVAMFYGQYLQDASGNQRRKYKVIANAFNDLSIIASKYKGAKVHIINNGERQ